MVKPWQRQTILTDLALTLLMYLDPIKDLECF